VSLNIVSMGQGPPVVMIHGLLLGSLAQWYFTAAPVLAKRHRVLLYDLRGHGRSPRARSGYDLATLQGDLAAVLTAEDIAGPVDLVGHSYGGLIALHHALRHPEGVRRLALVDVPLPPGRAEVFDDALGRSPEALLELLPERVRGDVATGGRRARRLLEGLRFLVQDSTLLSDVRAERDLDDGSLARIGCPTLLVYGESSGCLPGGERLVRVLPNARLTTVPGGHFLPVEAPRAMTAHLREFLDG
jgi:pimeloyl-ACP methyl ester carboxylesterase